MRLIIAGALLVGLTSFGQQARAAGSVPWLPASQAEGFADALPLQDPQYRRTSEYMSRENAYGQKLQDALNDPQRAGDIAERLFRADINECPLETGTPDAQERCRLALRWYAKIERIWEQQHPDEQTGNRMRVLAAPAPTYQEDPSAGFGNYQLPYIDPRTRPSVQPRSQPPARQPQPNRAPTPTTALPPGPPQPTSTVTGLSQDIAKQNAAGSLAAPAARTANGVRIDVAPSQSGGTDDLSQVRKDILRARQPGF